MDADANVYLDLTHSEPLGYNPTVLKNLYYEGAYKDAVCSQYKYNLNSKTVQQSRIKTDILVNSLIPGLHAFKFEISYASNVEEVFEQITNFAQIIHFSECKETDSCVLIDEYVDIKKLSKNVKNVFIQLFNPENLSFMDNKTINKIINDCKNANISVTLDDRTSISSVQEK